MSLSRNPWNRPEPADCVLIATESPAVRTRQIISGCFLAGKMTSAGKWLSKAARNARTTAAECRALPAPRPPLFVGAAGMPRSAPEGFRKALMPGGHPWT